jgi:hypothetical protein
MWIERAVLLESHAVKLLRLKRLVIVDCRDGATMEQAEAYLQSLLEESEAVPAAPAPAPVVEPVEEPEVEVEDLAVEDPDPEPEPEEVVEPVSEPEEGLVEEIPEKVTYTRDQLEGMHFRRELQPLAKSLGLPASGSKLDIAQRILNHQEGV